MVLMYIPRTLIHECHHDHIQEHFLDEHSSKDLNSPLFEEQECDFCAFDFDILDLPGSSFVPYKIQISSKLNSALNDNPFTEILNSLNSRGPPHIHYNIAVLSL